MKTLTLDQIVASLAEDRTEMAWQETTGKERLESGAPLSKAEWDELLQRAFNLVQEYPTSRKVSTLYRLVIARGIRDLDALIRAASLTEEDEGVRKWWTTLLYQVQPARFGIGSDLCTRDEAIALLDAMKAVAQLLKSEWFLGEVADYRAPGDHEVAKALKAAWKTW
jgi:hypothetical protein